MRKVDIEKLIRIRMIYLETELEKFKKRFPQLWKTRKEIK